VTAQPTLIVSVQRALHLLDAVGSSERPMTAKALARATGEKLPTTYHLLRTLVHEGYLSRRDGGYVLGERVSSLSARLHPPSLRERARPALAGLHDTLRAASYLVLYRDGELELVDVVDSPAAPRVDLWVDLTASGHATALGKAVLSALDEDGRRDYLARHELADLGGRLGAGLGRGLDSADVADDRHGDEPVADCVATDDDDVRRLDHRIRGFDRADQTLGLNHS